MRTHTGAFLLFFSLLLSLRYFTNILVVFIYLPLLHSLGQQVFSLAGALIFFYPPPNHLSKRWHHAIPVFLFFFSPLPGVLPAPPWLQTQQGLCSPLPHVEPLTCTSSHCVYPLPPTSLSGFLPSINFSQGAFLTFSTFVSQSALCCFWRHFSLGRPPPQKTLQLWALKTTVQSLLFLTPALRLRPD